VDSEADGPGAVDSFNNIIAREFLTTPDADLEVPVYGCRVLFYRRDDPTAHWSRLIAWITYDQQTAHNLRSELCHTMARRGVLSTPGSLRGYLKYDSEIWIPQAVRVVQLTEIPF
jgi:hypothetical protein